MTTTFDFDSMTDVILHIRNAAVREGMPRSSKPTTCSLLLDLKAEFPIAWEHFLAQKPSSGTSVLEFELREDHLPFYAKNEAVGCERS